MHFELIKNGTHIVLSVLSAEGQRWAGTGGAPSIESRYRLSYFLPNDVDR